MSRDGSPGTAMMSARYPGASRPSSSSASISSALVIVAARSACIGVMPRSTSAQSSLAFCPCGIAGASVPQAIRTPAAIAFGSIACALREDLLGLLAQLGGDTVDRHRLGEIGGRHEERVVIDHHLDGFVGGEEAVLDAVDACPDACPDGAVPHRMRGNSHTRPVGLVGDRGELVVGVLLRARRGAVRHHTARCGHLDQLGAVPDLVAHARAHLVDAVGDALGDRQRHDARRQTLEHRRIEMPAVRRHGVARRIDPRPDVPALLDRALQRDIEQIATGLHHQAEVAHRGEAGLERACGRSPRRAACGRRGRPAHRASGSAGPPDRRDRR